MTSPGKPRIQFRSSLLASRGFVSLALAYFAYEDLPKFLGEVDLTYFEEAAQLLCNHPKVSGHGIGVIGLSKGAEMALVIACYLPQVTATICINGTNAVTGNSLRYRDLLMPGIPYQMERSLITDTGTLDTIRTMEDLRKPEYQNSLFPLEKARGAILFLVGDKDQNYDSLFYAREALSSAQKYGKQDVYLQTYPGAGHLLEPPGSPFCFVSKAPLYPLPIVWGGELLPHCRAQESSWRETLDFLGKQIPCARPNKL